MYLIVLTIIGSIVSALVALVSLIRNSRSPVHWWLAIFIISACLWIVVGNIQVLLPADAILLAIKVTFVASGLVGFSLLYFSKVVSDSRVLSRILAFDISALLVVIVLSMSDAVVSGILSVEVSSLRPARGWGYPIVIAIILQFIIRGLIIVAKGLRKSKGRKRSQLRIIFTGLTGGTLLATITNVILPNVTGTTFTSRFAFLAVIIWTVLLVYAVVQYRFLDIRLAAIRSLGYIAAILSVIVIYLGLAALLISFVLPDVTRDPLSLQVYYISVAVFSSLTFHPLRLFFDRITRKVFYRNAYSSQEVLDEITSLYVRVVDPIELSRNVLLRISVTFRPAFATIIIFPGQSTAQLRIVRVGNSFGEEDVVNMLQKQNVSVVLEEDITNQRTSLSRYIYKRNIAMCIRLGAEKDVVGYMILGHKSNGSALTRQDTELVKIVADGLSVAIQNALRFEQIQKFSETMQVKVEEATRELRTTNAELQRLDEAKDEFVSMASHQLRTPLTSVKGYISMVLEGDAGKLTPMQRQLLSESFTSSERMVHLINDFLNVSRLQTGKFVLDRHEVNLAKLVEKEVESLRTTARMHGMEIKYRKPSYFPQLYLDEGKIRQVIMNFIDNAIYYSKEGSVITVQLSVIEGSAILEVRDTGIGVPEAEQSRLFGKFFRATNARKQRPDGTGVGLFLAKKVVVAHGGSMVFESTEGQGSTFGFRLPAKKLSRAPGKRTDKLEQ